MFHEFYCGVHVAQENFIRNLVKNEHSSGGAGYFVNSYEATNAINSTEPPGFQEEISDVDPIVVAPLPSTEFPSFPMEYDVKDGENEQIEMIKVESIEIDEDTAGLAFYLLSKY